MPRIVTFCPVRPRVTVGTLDWLGVGSSAKLACPEARVPIAPPTAAAFKKCLRLDPPPQTVRARSLMIHPSRLTRQTRCNTSNPSAPVGEPALWSLLCRHPQAMVNKELAEQKEPVLRGAAPALAFVAE